jgi:hypothetical protein
LINFGLFILFGLSDLEKKIKTEPKNKNRISYNFQPN